MDRYINIEKCASTEKEMREWDIKFMGKIEDGKDEKKGEKIVVK